MNGDLLLHGPFQIVKYFKPALPYTTMVPLLGKIGIVTCVIFAVLALLSFVVQDPALILTNPPGILGYSPPSAQHILGTDFMGRDLFVQLCEGAYAAFFSGIARAVIALPVLLCAAFVLSRIRPGPLVEDTPLVCYIRFIAFPLGVMSLMVISGFFLSAAIGTSLGWVLFVAGGFCYLGWLAAGQPMKAQFRKKPLYRKPILGLICTFFLLFMSYSVLYDGIMGFFGFNDPNIANWGMMVQWCYTSGYTFKAYHWLLPPIICVYVFSRGMLALSYSVYKMSYLPQ